MRWAEPILVVEDDHDVRDSLRDVLEENGYPVLCAGNGQEALDLLRTGVRPRVILLDLMMPVMSGHEFCRRHVADEALAPIPLVVLSADRGGIGWPTGPNVVAYLDKPVRLALLLATVDEASRAPQPAIQPPPTTSSPS